MADVHFDFAASADIGSFMNVHSDSVTESVSETVAVSGFCDNRTCNPVKLFSGFAHGVCVKSGKLCLKNGFVNFFHFVGAFADTYGSCHIRAIAVVQRAEIHCQKSLLDFSVTRNAVRTRRCASRYRDRVKGNRFRSVRTHVKFEFKRDFNLCAVRIYVSQNVFERRIGDFLRGNDGGYFVCIFLHAHSSDCTVRRYHSVFRKHAGLIFCLFETCQRVFLVGKCFDILGVEYLSDRSGREMLIDLNNPNI